jgi:hypothetical protein
MKFGLTTPPRRIRGRSRSSTLASYHRTSRTFRATDRKSAALELLQTAWPPPLRKLAKLVPPMAPRSPEEGWRQHASGPGPIGHRLFQQNRRGADSRRVSPRSAQHGFQVGFPVRKIEKREDIFFNKFSVDFGNGLGNCPADQETHKRAPLSRERRLKHCQIRLALEDKT